MRIRMMTAAALTLLISAGAALAQQEAADLPSDTDGQTGNSQQQQQQPAVVTIAATPPTKIEAFEQVPGAMIVKHFAKSATIASDDGGTINLYAVAVENTTKGTRLTGVAVELVQHGGRAARAYVDGDELDALLDAMTDVEKIARPDGPPNGPLDGIEARYQTRGHFQLINVDDGGSRAVVIHVLQVAPITGQVSIATLRIRAGRLAEVRQQIGAARDVLARGDAPK